MASTSALPNFCYCLHCQYSWRYIIPTGLNFQPAIQYNTVDPYAWKKMLPVGVIFQPTDAELLLHYLFVRAFRGYITPPGIISDANVYSYQPQDLIALAYDDSDGHMYFFSKLKKKYGSNKKSDRLVLDKGFWRATQKREDVEDGKGGIIGNKTSLVYHRYYGFDENDKKLNTRTNWLMNEYRLPIPDKSTKNEINNEEDELVLCEVYLTTRKRKREDDD